MKNLDCHLHNILLKIFFLFLLVMGVNPIQAEKADTLFLSDDILKIDLRTDFTAIQKDRSEVPTYHEGVLIYHPKHGKPVKFSVRVMARGNFRRDPQHCNFPPLFINFRKSEVSNTIFANQNRIKLVTHCQDEQNLIEEYAIYKMYNQVTDKSFKVRMARIRYFDNAQDTMMFTKYSFFLEDKEVVAERNDLVEKDRFVTPWDLNGENFMKLAFFQYMIGNKDWFVSSRKNLVLMQPKDSTQAPFVVPYDFDFAGMIDAPYTKPQGIPDQFLSKRRTFKGICYSEAELNRVFEFYRNLRPVFESIIKKQKLISSQKRKADLKYIDFLYQVMENKDLITQEFLTSCETKKDYNIR